MLFLKKLSEFVFRLNIYLSVHQWEEVYLCEISQNERDIKLKLIGRIKGTVLLERKAIFVQKFDLLQEEPLTGLLLSQEEQRYLRQVFYH